jgi:hypothetical protein
MRALLQKKYSILFHGSGTIEKTDPGFIGMLTIMLPIIVLIRPHMFFSYHKEKKKDFFFVLGMKFCPWPPFELIDVFSGSVGTDGARTRSFRLDRAVL